MRIDKAMVKEIRDLLTLLVGYQPRATEVIAYLNGLLDSDSRDSEVEADGSVWVIQRYLGEQASDVLAVCESRELADEAREKIREAGGPSGRYTMRYFQTIANSEHADNVARAYGRRGI